VPKAGPTVRCGILLLAACALPLTACDRGDHPNRIGAPAPEFSLTDSAPDTAQASAPEIPDAVDLAHLRGHIVILNFWASWCPPCIEETPSLLELQHRMPQLTILAISRDQDPAAYLRFLKRYHIDLITLRDPSMRIERLYGTAAIPESYVIDRNGILRRKFVSAQDWTSPEILDYLSKL
jgi:cytochrome c biogenesis protein CcmG, thiol:disulfide interchange protein DsbE